jgi:hypothetical protein
MRNEKEKIVTSIIKRKKENNKNKKKKKLKIKLKREEKLYN